MRPSTSVLSIPVSSNTDHPEFNGLAVMRVSDSNGFSIKLLYLLSIQPKLYSKLTLLNG